MARIYSTSYNFVTENCGLRIDSGRKFWETQLESFADPLSPDIQYKSH